MILLTEPHPLVRDLALHFTGQTYQRVSTLLVGAVLTTRPPAWPTTRPGSGSSAG